MDEQPVNTETIENALTNLRSARSDFAKWSRKHVGEILTKNDLSAVQAAEKVIHDNAEKWLSYLLQCVYNIEADNEHCYDELNRAGDVITATKHPPGSG